MPPPRFDEDLRFSEAVEDLAVEQLIAQAAVERFTIAILPRAARCDVKGLDADLCQPVLDGGSDELGAIVRPYVRWRAVEDEQISQDRQNVSAPDSARNQQRHTFPARFIDDRKDSELATIMGATLDEVVSPDMTRIFRTQPDARAIIEPWPASLWLLFGTFSPSRRQMRSTRFRFTYQPADRNNAVTRR